jgi:hypothetical protein
MGARAQRAPKRDRRVDTSPEAVERRRESQSGPGAPGVDTPPKPPLPIGEPVQPDRKPEDQPPEGEPVDPDKTPTPVTIATQDDDDRFDV